MLPSPKGMRFLALAICLLAQTACSSPKQLPPIISQPSVSPPASLEGEAHSIGQAEFSPDGRWLLWEHKAMYHNGALPQSVDWYVYDTRNLSQARRWKQSAETGYFSASWADDGSLIAVEQHSPPKNSNILRYANPTASAETLWTGSMYGYDSGLKSEKGQIAWIGADQKLYVMPTSGGTPTSFSLPESTDRLYGDVTVSAITPEAVLLTYQKSEEQSGQSLFKTLASPLPPSLYDLVRINRNDGKATLLAKDLKKTAEFSPDGQLAVIFSQAGMRLIQTLDGQLVKEFPELTYSLAGSGSWIDQNRLIAWDDKNKQFKIFKSSGEPLGTAQSYPELNNAILIRLQGTRLMIEGVDQTGDDVRFWLRSAEIQADGSLSAIKTLKENPQGEYFQQLANRRGPLLVSEMKGKQLSVLEIFSGKRLFDLPKEAS